MNRINNNSEKLFLQKWGILLIPSMRLKLTRLSNFIECQFFKIHYEKIGSESNILIAFHGFGQDSSSYNCMIDQLNNYYTVYVPELFFHGHSKWKKNDLFFNKQIWQDFLRNFLEKENIHEFSIIAYSLGARLALASLEAFPDQVRKIILIAPDGIRENFWYKTAVSTLPGRFLFRQFLNRPQLALFLVSKLRSWRFLSPSSFHLISKQIKKNSQCEKLFKTWLLFRRIRFNISDICQLIRVNHTRLMIVLGEDDPWFTTQTIRPITKRIKETPVIQLPANHAGLLRSFAEYCRANPELLRKF